MGRPITQTYIRSKTVEAGGWYSKTVTRKVEELWDIRDKEVRTEKAVYSMEAAAVMEVVMETESEVMALEVIYTVVDTLGMRSNTGDNYPLPPSRQKYTSVWPQVPS